jgi:hypothetical protein
MSISKDIIVDALRIRYDSYSAETVFELACQRAQLEGKTTFDGKELAAFRSALEKVGDRVGGVLARLDDLGGGAPAPAKDAKQDSKPNEKAVEKTEAKDKSDGKPTEKATEAKSDSKPNDSKPNEAKSDSKPNAQPAEAKDKSDSKPNDKPAEAKSEGKPAEAKP